MVVLAFLISLVCLLLVGSQNVVELNWNEVQKVAMETDALMVVYHAPWCGYCKTLLEELKYVAADLYTQNIPARIVSVDVSRHENKDVVESEKLSGYPSIMIYKYGSKLNPYLGSRKRNYMLEYLKRKVGPPMPKVSSFEQINEYLKRYEDEYIRKVESGDTDMVRAVFIAVFVSDSRPAGYTAKQLASFADTMDSAVFLYTDDSELAQMFNVRQDSLVAYIMGVTRTAPMMIDISDAPTTHGLLGKILSATVPNVYEFDEALRPIIRTIPLDHHALVFYDENKPKTNVKLQRVIKNLAPQYRGSVLFLKVSSSQRHLCSTFDIKTFPQVLLLKISRDDIANRYSYYDYFNKYIKSSSDSTSPITMSDHHVHDVNDVNNVNNVDDEAVEEVPPLCDNPDFMEGCQANHNDNDGHNDNDNDNNNDNDNDNDNNNDNDNDNDNDYDNDHGDGDGDDGNSDLRSGDDDIHEGKAWNEDLDSEMIDEDNDDSNNNDNDNDNDNDDSNDEQWLQAMLNEKHLSGFLNRALVDDLESAFSSESIETIQQINARSVGKAKYVENIAALQFENKVLSSPVVAVVYIHASWCSFCKAFEALYAEAAYRLRERVDIKLFRLDGAKNDIVKPVIKIPGYPSVFLFPLNDKMKPVEFPYERTVENLLTFINHHANNAEERVVPTLSD